MVADSGYASGNEDGDEWDAVSGERAEAKDAQMQIQDASSSSRSSSSILASSLRADSFEHAFAERWLTGFIARAEELTGCFSSDDARERAIEIASCVLSSFFTSNGSSAVATAEEEEEESTQITREFFFELAVPGSSSDRDANGGAAEETTTTVKVRLNDGLAGSRSDDHTDVGLQSWGASIVFSELMCASPARFGLTTTTEENPPRNLRIVELGAGTGLVSLVLATALPRLGVDNATVIATDYHVAVLANLRANIATNFPPPPSPPEGAVPAAAVEACQLDWSAPSPALALPPLAGAVPADVLVATDVVYAPEHASWLRKCASRMLAPEGVFWLVATVRPNGKFEGISGTVRAAFSSATATDSVGHGLDNGGDPNGKRRRRMLTILSEEWLEKRKGVGRGDESGYRLFRIGWA